MDAVRNLKANLKLENKPCGWCQTGLQIGEDASVCFFEWNRLNPERLDVVENDAERLIDSDHMKR